MDFPSLNAGLASDPNTVLSPTVLVVGQWVAGEIVEAAGQIAGPGRWLQVSTPEAAIAHWQAQPPDLALVALGVPGRDGLAFLAALANLEEIRPLPVVVWVRPGQERLALQAMKLGAADYFLADQALAAEALTSEPLADQPLAGQPLVDQRPIHERGAALLWDCLQQACCQVQAQRWRQRQTTQALHQAQQQYQNLVENSPDIIERFDLNLRHLYVSPALTEITGIPSEALIGKSCREMSLPDDMVTRWEAAAARLIATGAKQMIEFSTPTPLALRHFEMVLVPEWDDQHRLSSILCISRDITDHVAARQAQAQQFAEAEIARIEATTAQSLLASVFERISDGIVALDTQERIVYINQRATHFLNRAASDLLGQVIWDAFPEAPDQPFYADVKRAIQQQCPVYENHFYPPYQRWFEGRIYPSTDGTTLYFTDITDRKQAEADLLQTQKLRLELTLLEQTLDSILAGYWDIDFASGAAYMSPGLKRMFGYTDEELPNLPDTWQRLIFAEDLPIALKGMERHIASHGAEPYYTEVRYHHKDGSMVWVICAGRVIDWDEAGNPLYMVGCHVDITRLKEVEAKLKKSEAHLQEAQRIGKVGSWNFELATEKIIWSDQLYQIYGLEVGAVIPNFEALQAHFHPEDRERHRQTVEAILATHQPYDETFRILRPDGTLRYTQVRGEAVLNAAGDLTHLTGVTQDVTEPKQAEAQLEALSLRLSLALDSGQIGTWELDLATYTVNWDRRIYEIYGMVDLTPSITYEVWAQTLHPEDYPRIEAALKATIDQDAPFNIEFRARRRDGEWRWIKATALVLRDNQGKPERMVGTNTDVTATKQVEAQLRELSLRLSLALESGKIGTWEIDMVTYQINWDQRMADMYGRQEIGAEVSLHDWRAYLHPEDVAQVDADFAGVFEGQPPSTLAFRIWRGDGELRWIKATALVQRDATGRPLRMIGTNSDITEAKQAEEKLLRTRGQLEASNHELEAFAYSVSHDLRAPLRAIDGFSLALIEDYGDQLDAEGQDYFNRIRHNVKRMGALIDDLLRLSRVSRAAMNYQPVNLSALVEAQLQEFQTAEPARAVTAAITANLTVWADPVLMQAAITNLVENAWKFTSHHPTATLEFGQMTEAGEPIYYLRDDGAGFDMAFANKLFGVFQRLHNTDEFPGTGIGLATVQRIIHRHGGRVWAEGVIEQGATIYFTVPPPSPLQES